MIYTETEIKSVVEYFIMEVEGGRKNFAMAIWAKFFRPKPAHIIGLSGNLGAGKTTFTKHLLEHFGYTGSVVSPTFVLRRDYDISRRPTSGKWEKIIHIDAYRLDNPIMIGQIISEEELKDTKNLILIEWPEKLDLNIFDKIFLFEHVSSEERKISILK